MYMVFITEGLLEIAIENWPEWDLNLRSLNSVHIYIYIYIYIHTYMFLTSTSQQAELCNEPIKSFILNTQNIC